MSRARASYLDSGRSVQKHETRAAILDAAASLLSSGVAGPQPAMADIAAVAGVGRATAYRYFPSVEALLLEAGLHGRAADPETVLGDESRLREGVQRAMDYLWDLAATNEAEFRIYLKSTLQEWIRRGADGETPGEQAEAHRGGRRLAMLRAALERSREVDTIPAVVRDRLVHALAALTGIEFLVAMRDICGLDNDAASDVMTWATDALVRAALAESEAQSAAESAESD